MQVVTVHVANVRPYKSLTAYKETSTFQVGMLDGGTTRLSSGHISDSPRSGCLSNRLVLKVLI